jgi:hypothetical protein
MLVFTLLWSLFATVAFAAFGYVDNGDHYTIDSGSKLVIEVSKTNGDIQSMKYNVCTALIPLQRILSCMNSLVGLDTVPEE